MTIPWQLPCSILLLATSVAAQDASYGVPRGPREPLPPMRQPVVTPAENQPLLGDDGRAAPWQPPAPAVAPGESLFDLMPDDLCGLEASTRPAVLNPGESGKLFVVAALHGTTVLAANGRFELQYEAPQSAIGLGRWQLQPPPANGRAAGMGDRPVYAESALVEIPITIAADAAPGRHRVALRCTAELFDGDAGKSLGTFHRDLAVDITVRRRTETGAPPEIHSQVLLPEAAAAAPATEPLLPAPAPSAIADDPLPLLLGAAGALLALLLLALLRARR